jgi:acyl-CoA thioester hydrolase
MFYYWSPRTVPVLGAGAYGRAQDQAWFVCDTVSGSRTRQGPPLEIGVARTFRPRWAPSAGLKLLAVSTAATKRNQRDRSLRMVWIGEERADGWFSLRKRVLPRDTDYAGVVWHGRYVDWFEEARVAYLFYRGMAYESLVQEHQCETPVVHMSLNYRRAVRFGDEVLVQVRVLSSNRASVRIPFACRVVAVASSSDLTDASDEDLHICVDGRVDLVIVERHTGRVLRRAPRQLQEALYGKKPGNSDVIQ